MARTPNAIKFHSGGWWMCQFYQTIEHRHTLTPQCEAHIRKFACNEILSTEKTDLGGIVCVVTWTTSWCSKNAKSWCTKLNRGQFDGKPKCVCVCVILRVFFFVLEKFAMQKRLSVSSSKRIWDFPKKMHFTEPKPSAEEKKSSNTIRKMRTISLNEVCHLNWIAYLPRFSMDPFVVMVAGNSCKNRHNASLKKNSFEGFRSNKQNTFQKPN